MTGLDGGDGVRFGEADLTDCDREPIRIPGSVQPHGVLLALDPESLKIVQIAGDTEKLLGTAPEEFLDRRIDHRLGAAVMERIGTLVEHDQLLPRPFFILDVTLDGQHFDVCAHMSDGLVVLELERRAVEPPEDGIALVQKLMGSVQTADSLPVLLDRVARGVQSASGFDRVMVYRFDADGSGHVVAERRSSDAIESFLDLHYPASDIPVQARELYCSCWIRNVPDARYVPRPLEPALNPLTGRPLDMSFGLLRSVSPVHLEYLANMGVVASMSLSIVVDGRLWGLVACHHHQPRYLNSRVRAALELFAQLSSLQIKTRLELDLSKKRVATRDILAQLVATLSSDGMAGMLVNQPNLLDLIPAGGVAVTVDGVVTTLGTTPPVSAIAELTAWLNLEMVDGIHATQDLAATYAPAADFIACGAGLLALGISRVPRDYVLWFLPEMVRTVTWGGKPDKTIASGPLGDRLTPRKSFEAWTETVRGMSRAWAPVEYEGATALRVAILEVVLETIDRLAREQEMARAHQNLLMTELDHRVKNTLATIQALVRSSGATADDLVEYTHALGRRLRAMAIAHDLLTEGRWSGAPLRALVTSELASHRADGHPNITIEGEELELEPKATIAVALVLHELATNAAKYGSLSVDEGSVSVCWERRISDGAEWLYVAWVERGGPPVTPPTRMGFGRTLMEQAFAYDVRGRAQLDFDPAGVTCSLWIPYERVRGIDGASDRST